VTLPPLVLGSSPGRWRFAASATARALFLATALVAGAGPALAAEVTTPVPLGASGLTLTLRLAKQAAPAAAWVPGQAVDDLVVTELGATGSYAVSELPTAVGTERYHLELALAADPGRVLYDVTWGARPGVTILWLPEIELPASPQVFKVGDTFGTISMRVPRRLPAAACEPEAVATFTLWSQSSGAAVDDIDDAAATISNCTLDETTATYGATFSYDLADGTPATAGLYLGEWRICYEPGVCHTLPPDNRVQVRFTSRFGS
jgi:hypothetical protein